MHHLILVGGARQKADAPSGPVPMRSLPPRLGSEPLCFPSTKIKCPATFSGPAVVEANFFSLRECCGRLLHSWTRPSRSTHDKFMLLVYLGSFCMGLQITVTWPICLSFISGLLIVIFYHVDPLGRSR